MGRAIGTATSVLRRNPAAFPTRRGKKAVESAAEVEEEYLKNYVKRYYEGRERVIILKDVKTKPDPAVDEVLKAYKKVPPEDLERTGEERLSMQAENIVGQPWKHTWAAYSNRKGGFGAVGKR